MLTISYKNQPKADKHVAIVREFIVVRMDTVLLSRRKPHFWVPSRPPDAKAVRRLLEAAKETEYYEAIHTAFYTGLRRGEVFGLRWYDIDLDMATASVSRTVYRAKGGE